MILLTLWSHFDPGPMHGWREMNRQTHSSRCLYNSVICTISSTWMLWIWHFSAASSCKLLENLIWHFSAALSCKLLENLICFSLITSSIEMCFLPHTSLLPCISPPYTLFFLTNRNMTVEVENTGLVVGFLDPECLCSTTLNNTDNTLLLSLCPICSMPSNYMLKRI
jgi:hypothetical protein